MRNRSIELSNHIVAGLGDGTITGIGVALLIDELVDEAIAEVVKVAERRIRFILLDPPPPMAATTDRSHLIFEVLRDAEATGRVPLL